MLLIWLAQADGQITFSQSIVSVFFRPIRCLDARVRHPQSVMVAGKRKTGLHAPLGVAKSLARRKDAQQQAFNMNQPQGAGLLNHLGDENLIVETVVGAASVPPQRGFGLGKRRQAVPLKTPAFFQYFFGSSSQFSRW